MLNILIIVLAVFLLAGLLYYENGENPKGLLLTKTALSSLFVLAVLVQPHPIPTYFHLLLAGLVFCLMGDVFLTLPQQRMFLFGLISFLIGHVFYIFGFFFVVLAREWTWVAPLILILISGLVFFWLRPHLGTMKVPVLFYVIVITIMVYGAWSVFGDTNLAKAGRIMVVAGAISFYFSDLFVARDRFLKREFLNRLIGLPMYYTAQFLLAFSVGLLKWPGAC